MKKLELAINSLLRDRPFYAHFFLNSKVVMDKHGVKTAAATLTTESPTLIFNTEFIESLKVSEVTAIVEHEVLHLLFEHCKSMKKGKQGPVHFVANVAMDCSINQYISGLPSGGVAFEQVNKMCGGKLEPYQNWQYYYQHLMQHAEEAAKSFTLTDDHDLVTGEEMDLSDAMAAAVLRSTMDQAMKASAGNAPEAVLKIYGELTQPSKLPWTQILRNFVARCTTSTTLATRKRANRRFGFEMPGKKKKRELVLGVCADSSGSVSDQDFQSFLAEIQSITKNCAAVHFVEADCEVQKVDKLKKGKKVKLERRGHGGTAYQPAIDKCLRLGCDAIVYFGDFDCADTPTNPGVPFLWVGVGTQDPPGKFGSVVRL